MGKKMYEQNDALQSQKPVVQQFFTRTVPSQEELQDRAKQGYNWDGNNWRFVGTISSTGGKPSTDTRTATQRNKDYWNFWKGATDRWKASWDNNTNPVKAALDNGLGTMIPGINVVQAVYSGYQTFKDASKGNPLAIVDAALTTASGARSLSNLRQIARRAAYNNITPFGYNDNANLGLGKVKELWNTAKEILTGGQYGKQGVPKYIQNLGSTEHLKNSKAQLNDKAMIRFRDQAWRKAMKQPQLESEPQIYVKNIDGTYRYDIDAVNQIRKETGNPDFMYQSPKIYQNGEYTGLNGDVITTNGGYVGYKDGIIEDVWDLHPFKDSRRALWPWMSKIPGLKNLEVVSFLGGEKFKLKHDLFND